MCQAAAGMQAKVVSSGDERVRQQVLVDLNHRRLTPSRPLGEPFMQWAQDQEAMLMEHQFLEHERAIVAARAATVPCEAQAFAAWFDALEDSGPGQHDPLFDFLACQASMAQVRWFMQQEVAGEAGFEDLVALTQLRMPEQAKLELARNYWDEMGRGKPAAMHGPMLATLAEALGLHASEPEDIVPEALALSNVLVGLAYNRRYAYHALGALGVIELTAPSRAVKLVQAFDRLNVAREASHYFRVHAVVDVAHARTWRDEILIPVVREQPEVAVYIAEGALMRLQAGARTFERYRREFGLQVSVATDGLAWLD
jgi:Iron-containing redox enzyme